MCLNIVVQGVPSPLDVEDFPVWLWEKNHFFPVKSIYEMLLGSRNVNQGRLWKTIWKSKHPQKVKVFLWLVSTGKLLTTEGRMRQHLADDPM